MNIIWHTRGGTLLDYIPYTVEYRIGRIKTNRLDQKKSGNYEQKLIRKSTHRVMFYVIWRQNGVL